MNSGKFSLLDSARFLWSISPEVWQSGVRGRLGTIRISMTRGNRASSGLGASALLIDHNPSKVAHAERVFGRPMTLVDPLTASHRLPWRVLLVLACLLPDRAREVATALIHAGNLRHLVRSDQQIFLWNPYTLLQFAVDEVLGTDAAYHLDASYPALRRVQKAHGCQVALDLIGYDHATQVEALQPWSRQRSEPVLVVYLCKLDELARCASERGLLEAVRAWRHHTNLPIEIYIHYTDRGVARDAPRHSAFFGEFGDLVSEGNSLDQLSSNQISLSALSTIGLDLLSMDIAHFVMVPGSLQEEADGGWRERLDPKRVDVLRSDEPPDRWLDTIRNQHPVLSEQVFKEQE